jgi:HEPN domain-containing protein
MRNDIEFIKEWIIKADHDLGTAILTFQHIPEYSDTIAFHCQQAVEKYLKGYLIFLNIEFRKVHDLVYLYELIFDNDNMIEEFYQLILELQTYSVKIRYPNEIIFLSNEQIISAIETSKKIRKWVLSKIKIDNPFKFDE